MYKQAKQQGKLGKYPCMIACLMGEKKQSRFAAEYVHSMYRKVASSRPVYYSKVIGQRPKVTVHKDQISPS